MLLDAKGAAIEDLWSTAPEGELAPETLQFNRIYGLEQLVRLGGLAAATGLRVGCDARIESFAHLLPHLTLVVIHFAKFRDGRGFTLSRAIRERFGFRGEIRAEGPLLSDQFPLLMRCGFSTITIPDDHQARWSAILEQFRHSPARPMLQRLRSGAD